MVFTVFLPSIDRVVKLNSMSSEMKKHIGTLIQEARKQKGLSQTELADKLGLSQAAVNRYESGRQNLTIETIQKIATALKAEININFQP